MEFGMALTLIVGGVFGWVLGYFIGRMFERKTVEETPSVGTLHVETSDPDGPYLFLELSTDVSNVCSMTQVMLDVDTKSYISQE